MSAYFVIKNEAFAIDSVDGFQEGIFKIVELAKELKTLEDVYGYHPDSFYQISTPLGSFSNILWEEQNNILDRDLKLSFRLFINRAEILKQECGNINEAQNLTNRDHCGFLGISFEHCTTNPDYEVSAKEELFKFHRHYLCAHPPEKQDFIDIMSKYFPRIYFHSTVPQQLRTLHYEYTEIFTTIVKHLEVINDDFYNLFQQHINQGASRVCGILSPSLDRRIEISRDNRNHDDLCYDFENIHGEDQRLYCHLHTKFKGYWEFEGRQDHGDRIYFTHPRENFQDGKILLARIGRHSD